MGLEGILAFGDKILSVNHAQINVAIGLSTSANSMLAIWFVFASLFVGGQELGVDFTCECSSKNVLLFYSFLSYIPLQGKLVWWFQCQEKKYISLICIYDY